MCVCGGGAEGVLGCVASASISTRHWKPLSSLHNCEVSTHTPLEMGTTSFLTVAWGKLWELA